MQWETTVGILILLNSKSDQNIQDVCRLRGKKKNQIPFVLLLAILLFVN